MNNYKYNLLIIQKGRGGREGKGKIQTLKNIEKIKTV
jgi:hypothetical protein